MPMARKNKRPNELWHFTSQTLVGMAESLERDREKILSVWKEMFVEVL
jgi:hypothetical protein